MSPAAPPTRPGAVNPIRPPIWPRLIAILGWMVSVTSGLLGGAALLYPPFSNWLQGRLGPDMQDDFAGMLVRYRLPDTLIEIATIVLAAWLFVICRRLFRYDPAAPALLRRWCLLKLIAEAVNCAIVFVQINQHAGSRADLSAGAAQGFEIGMTVWSMATGLTLPLLAYMWLIVPRIRRKVLVPLKNRGVAGA